MLNKKVIRSIYGDTEAPEMLQNTFCIIQCLLFILTQSPEEGTVDRFPDE